MIQCFVNSASVGNFRATILHIIHVVALPLYCEPPRIFLAHQEDHEKVSNYSILHTIQAKLKMAEDIPSDHIPFPYPGTSAFGSEQSGDDAWKYRAPYQIQKEEFGPVKWTAKCHCGRVEYQIQREKPLAAKFCHCRACQALHGPFDFSYHLSGRTCPCTKAPTKILILHDMLINYLP